MIHITPMPIYLLCFILFLKKKIKNLNLIMQEEITIVDQNRQCGIPKSLNMIAGIFID